MNGGRRGQPIWILLIGSLDGSTGGSAAGGTSILLRCLVDALQRRQDVKLSVVDIGCSRERIGFLNDIARGVTFPWKVARDICRADVVSLHAVSTKLWFTGMMTLLLSRMLGKPVIVRKFAGTDYNEFPLWKRRITKWVLARCDLYLAETRHLVNVARKRDGIAKCHWFPTHRPVDVNPDPSPQKVACRRFVYIGQVREYKGIRELVEAAERLDDGITVDVYGPLFPDVPGHLFDNRRNISYRGAIEHRDVVSTMRRYDAFILPTKAATEGYPGAIIEAYGAGLPVITTTCGAIPEIVGNTSGILVKPGDVTALQQAMKRLSDDSQLYIHLCRGAREWAGQFSAEYWADVFVGYCRELIAGTKRM